MNGRRRKLLMLTLAALLLAGGCSDRPAAEAAGAAATAPAAVSAVPAPPETAPAASSAPEAAAVPAETPAPSPTAAPEVRPGSYSYYADDAGSWTLNLKDNGTFSLLHGDKIYNGEGWITNFDGTVTTGPTEAAGAAPFFDEFGSSVWAVSGSTCTPVY